MKKWVIQRERKITPVGSDIGEVKNMSVFSCSFRTMNTKLIVSVFSLNKVSLLPFTVLMYYNEVTFFYYYF